MPVRHMAHYVAWFCVNNHLLSCTVDDYGNLVYASSVQMSVYYDQWRWSL